MRRSVCGFSLLELMIAVVLIGVSAAVLLERLYYYQEAAEKADMEYTISALRSALRLRESELMLAGRTQEWRQLARQNPMNWLGAKPKSYAGEILSTSSPAAAGRWYFIPAERMLVYSVRNGRHFQADAAGRTQVKLRLELMPNQPQAADADTASDSVRLVLDAPYRWLQS